MSRPLEYMPGERVHVGTKFNKYVAELLEALSRRHGYNRTQTLEFLVINAIVENHIPARNTKIDDMIEQLKAQEEQNVVRGGKTVRESKGRLVSGKPTETESRSGGNVVVNQKT